MIVNRRTFNVKRGRMEEAVALAEAERERQGSTWRCYTPNIAPFGVIAFEFEFENLAEYEKAWAEWGATPEAAAFNEKWGALLETGGTNEIWTLVE